MHSRLNRRYTDWTYIGFLTGSFDFPESCQQFQEMLAPGEYWAKYDQNKDVWFFTKEPSGDFRYPHYTIEYTGNGSETKNEHFTYARDMHISASSLPKRDVRNRFNSELDRVASSYPEVRDYYV